jgi:hypothetical protein
MSQNRTHRCPAGILALEGHNEAHGNTTCVIFRPA